jgi:hypothetical protein
MPTTRTRALDSIQMLAQSARQDRHRTRRNHVVIAGTGRAGTSFLVRFLGECGLDVGFPDDSFDDRARAGLEHHLLDDDAPYVVKDPWLFTYCDGVDPDLIEIDALLVPVRELLASATSRVLQDRIAMAGGSFGRWPPSDVNGVVTGGVVYSLDPVDQARILAVGFHRLIHWATARRIPLFLLEFPRTVNDGGYLIETLWPWLSSHCERERAAAAFSSVADPQLVRIQEEAGGELSANGSHDASTLDRDAMSIVLKERDSLMARLEDQLAEVREVLANTDRELTEVRNVLARREATAASIELQLDDTRTELASLQRRLVAANHDLANRNVVIDEMQAKLHAAAAEAEAVRRTVSWRVTRPFRRLKSALR